MKIYGNNVSGNCYKVRLLLAHLGGKFEMEMVNSVKGETLTPEFLAKNPNGKIPVLEYAPGKFLAESGAILYYLAEGTPFWPDDKLARAQVLQWMFFEQFSHCPNLAQARFIRRFLTADHPRHAELPGLLQRGAQALAVMEQHLAENKFFIGDAYTIADIALFAYTHIGEEGGFRLSDYPNVGRWMGDVRAQPGFVAIY